MFGTTCGVGGVGRAAAVSKLQMYIRKVGWNKLPDIDSVRVDGVKILTNSNVTLQLEPFDIDCRVKAA